MVQCRLRTEDGEEVLSLDELEARLRTGDVPATAWVSVAGMTQGFVRLKDAPFARAWDPVRRARFKAAFALDRIPWLVLLICAACVAEFVLIRQSLEGPVTLDALVRWGARARTAVLVDAEPWRLWSAALLHRDQLHLLFNVVVFLAVGGALESIYSRLGVLAVVMWGALSSSLLSLWLGPQVTVGLSGVVFAGLGAAISFGVRFRDVLRRPYQQWFGVVALAYALFALWTGAREPDVDHAGHLGGLMGGLAVALFLPPRQWDGGLAAVQRELAAVLVALAGSGVISLAIIVAASEPRPSVAFKVPSAGITWQVPWGFRPVVDAFGLQAMDNGLDAQVSLGCARAESAWPRWAGHGTPATEIAREFGRLALARDLLDFASSPAGWTAVGSEVQPPGAAWPAQEVQFTYRVEGETVRARLIAWERGLGRCALVLASGPGVKPWRAETLDRVRRTISFHDTDALAKARERLERDETDVFAWLDVGLTALHQGDVSLSRRSLLRVTTLGDDVFVIARAHHALAQLGLLTRDAPFARFHADTARELAPSGNVAAGVSLYGALRMAGLKDSAQARALSRALKETRDGAVLP